MEKLNTIIQTKNPYIVEEYCMGLNPQEREKKKVLKEILTAWNKPDDWSLYDLKLEHAFGILLKKPLDEFDSQTHYFTFFNFTEDIANENFESQRTFFECNFSDNKKDKL